MKRAAAFFAWILVPLTVSAYVNPNFTPIDLIRQSETVWHLRLSGDPSDGNLQGELVEVLKGEAGPTTIQLSLEDMFSEDRREFIDHFGYSVDGDALYFAGDFGDAAEGGFDEVAGALLHVGAQWFTLQVGDEEGTWSVGEIDPNMLAVYNGGSEMLARMSQYIISHSFPEVPVEAGIGWGNLVEVADDLLAETYSLQAVDLDGKLPLGLWVLSPAGDRFYRADADGVLQDETSARGIETSSRLGTVGDFTGNGAIDLLVYGESGLTLLSNDGSGSFSAAAHELPAGTNLWGLATLGGGDRSVAVVATGGHPRIIRFDDDGMHWSDLGEGDLPGTVVEQKHDILVADLTGNGQEDVLLPLVEGVLVYSREGDGWGEPVFSDGMAVGAGPVYLTPIDFDADGLIDVVISGNNPTLFLQNRGKAEMREVRAVSGEPSYISAPNAVGISAFDQNNNGRTDLLAFYPRSGLHFFFNRGFRSFAFAIDADPNTVDRGITGGQKAGLTGVFTPDGIFSAAMILNDGRLVLLPRAEGGPELAARVGLAGSVAGAGSRIVYGVQEDRPLAAQVAAPGRLGAYLGGGEFPGPLEIRWTDSEGTAHSVEIILEEGVHELLLEN